MTCSYQNAVMRPHGGLLALFGALLLWLTPLLPPARGLADAGITFGPNDVTSVFHIKKSENRNQVHYAVRLDERCRPIGEAPVFAYWQEHEQGPDIVLPLTALERRAYGIYRQRIELMQARSGRVVLSLEAARNRPVMVETYRDERYRCQARALTRIGEERKALMDHIYVKIGMLKRIEYVQLTGASLLGGKALRERSAE